MTALVESADGSVPICHARDSLESRDGTSSSSLMQALDSQSLVSTLSNANRSPVSPKLAGAVKILGGSLPSSQTGTVVDQSLDLPSPKLNGSSSLINASGDQPLVNLDGSLSYSSLPPMETHGSKQTLTSPSNRDGLSVSSSLNDSVDQEKSLAASVHNSNGSSFSSSMEALERCSLNSPSSNGVGSLLSSPMLAADVYQPISIIMPGYSVSLNDKACSSPKNNSPSFLPFDLEEDNPQEHHSSSCRGWGQHGTSIPISRDDTPGFLGWHDSSFSKWLEASETKEIQPAGVGAGLSNLGNTCFMNSILQCFTHTVPLVQALSTYDHPMPCDCNTEGFCVICTLRDHIELSLCSSGGVVSPWKLVDNLNYFSSCFLRYQQEDAHEFLQSFLDKLERCCLDSKKKDGCLSSQDINLVERVFGGCLISRLRCCSCGHYSDTYEPSLGLSLEIENVNTLKSALESFTSVEKLDDPGMKFTCENCKEKVSKDKQLKVDQTPAVAAFHLKRFKNDGTSVEKIYKHVEFPLELDLKPYTSSSQNSDVELKYRLYALVEHIGDSLNSGHYLSYIRSSPNTWHKLDDSQVSRVQEEFVISQDAYILFYARQDTPWFSSIFEMRRQMFDKRRSNSSPESVLDMRDAYCSDHRIEENDNYEPNVSSDKETPNSLPLATRDGLSGVNDGLSLSEYRETKADVVMSNASVPSKVSHSEKLCNMPSVEENKSCGHIDNDARSNGCPSVSGSRYCSPLKQQQEVSYCIPRDHLKSEMQATRKRPSSKVPQDVNRGLALRCLKKHMPGSRAMMLSAAMGVQHNGYLNKKKKKLSSSPCKRASPPANRQRNQEPVMRPVAILR